MWLVDLPSLALSAHRRFMRQESTSVAFSSLAGYPPQRPVTLDNPSWGLSIPEIVDPRDVQVLHRPEDAELTLVTWYRFITWDRCRSASLFTRDNSAACALTTTLATSTAHQAHSLCSTTTTCASLEPRSTAGEHHAELFVFDCVCSKKLFDDQCDRRAWSCRATQRKSK